MNSLTIEGLTAGYDEAAVIRELDLVVDAGEVVALLGANGAGNDHVAGDLRDRAIRSPGACFVGREVAALAERAGSARDRPVPEGRGCSSG